MVRAPAIPSEVFRGFLRSHWGNIRLLLLPSTHFPINYSPFILSFLRQRHCLEINHKQEKTAKEAGRVGERELLEE
jgi:hypothetical protein